MKADIKLYGFKTSDFKGVLLTCVCNSSFKGNREGLRADHELAGQTIGRGLPDCLLRLYRDQDS